MHIQGGIFMEYTKLGNSDLNVSRICMGCMGFGNAKSGMHSWTVDEEHSREILKRGLELGVNFFDTAAGYQGGTSEQYLGRALRDFAKRDEVVVATKFFPRSAEEIANGVSGIADCNVPESKQIWPSRSYPQYNLLLRAAMQSSWKYRAHVLFRK